MPLVIAEVPEAVAALVLICTNVPRNAHSSSIVQRAIGDNSSDESKPSAGSSEELGRIYYG